MMNRKGFTLVEIMIVVAIIALLAAIAIPNLLRARVNANDSAIQSYLRSVSTAMESYASANDGCYPQAAAELTTAVPPYIDASMVNDAAFTKYGHTITTTFATDCDAGNAYTVAAVEIANQSDQSWQITTGGVIDRTDS